MHLKNVKLIFFREIRDQLRDRRTLFMIAVLPILLYPLLGMGFIQIKQFIQEQATDVLVVGARDLPDDPPLIVNRRFSSELFRNPKDARLLELHFARSEPDGDEQALDPRAAARREVQSGKYDAAIYFPEDFAKALEAVRQAVEEGAERNVTVPRPEIIHTTASEKSQITFVRLSRVLDRWTDGIGEKNLLVGGIPISAARPFEVDMADVADDTAYRGAAMWSKILPVILLIWALTGAFYPAIDLCAGEKERGTLETLLSSPAGRTEIALGKLLTIMVFSMVTAVLNLASIALTGYLIFGRLAEFSAPPPTAVFWLLVALVPISAFFSALCLALAAFARSTKEGQYYLMPLLLLVMPLAVLPMSPGVELNLGSSLIPVTGVVLLLRNVLEGNGYQALEFLPVVLSVTLAACFLSIRWAVDQFNSEDVLFRESERLDVWLRLRHLMRDRKPTPSVAAAMFCGVLILMVRFFISSTMAPPEGFGGFVKMAMATQLAVIAAPALLMTVLLARSIRQTLLLRLPSWRTVTGAALLAVVLHPTAIWLQVLVSKLYPVSDEITAAIEGLLGHAPGFWQLVLLIAVVPAVCEELAFRGFILSGFRHIGHKWRAIVYSALLFGLTHAVLQQSLIACLTGVVIGYVAVQSGSIVPCMVFHVLHNTLALANAQITRELLERSPMLGAMMTPAADGRCVYQWQVVAFGILAAGLLLAWFGRLQYAKSPEEELQDAIRRGLYE